MKDEKFYVMLRLSKHDELEAIGYRIHSSRALSADRQAQSDNP